MSRSAVQPGGVFRSFAHNNVRFDATAGSGERALALLEQAEQGNSYQLVLMDWKKPGLDGIGTTRAI